MTEKSVFNDKKTASQTDTVPVAEFKPEKADNANQNKRREPKTDVKKIAKISAGVFLSLFIAACSVFIFFFYTHDVVWHERIDPVFYIENETLICADLSKPDKTPLSISSYIPSDGAYGLDSFCLSNDKKHLIFTTDFKEIDEFFTLSYDLVYFSLEFPENGCTVLAQDVTGYSVNESFDTLTYVRSADGVPTLYQSDFSGNEELICEAFGIYEICLESRELIYTDKKGSVYLKDYGKEPLLLSHKAVPVYADESFNEFILCSEDGRLFRITDDKKITVISENAAYESYRKGIFPEFHNGTGFYLTSSQSYSIADFIVDDMLEKDRKLRYTDDGYEAKLMRDAIRASMKQEDSSFCLNNIFYYDGNKSYPVAENAAAFIGVESVGSDESRNDIILYTKLKSIDSLKIRMSELDEESAYLLSTGELTQIKNNSCDLFMAVKNTHSKKLKSDPYRIDKCSFEEESGKLLLSVFNSVSSPDPDAPVLSTVYHSTVRDGKASDFTVLDKNVSEGRLYFLSDGKAAYLKPDAEKEDSFSLYADAEKIYGNIRPSASYNKVSKALLVSSLPEESGTFSYTLLNGDSIASFTFAEGTESILPYITEKGNILLQQGNTVCRVRKDELVTWKTDCDALVFPLRPDELSEGSGTDFSTIDDSVM